MLAVDLVEDMNSERLLTEFKIGINNIKLTFELLNQGTIDEMASKLQKFFDEPPTDANDKKELLVEMDYVTYYLRRDNNVCYLFTSQPLDHEGCFYGRDEWAQPQPELPVGEEFEGEFITELTEEDEEEEKEEIHEELKHEDDIDDANAYNDLLFQSTIDEEERPPMPKHYESYWKEIAERDGRAFIAWFTKPEYLIEHIMLNLPIEVQKNEKYSLKKIAVNAGVETKDHFDPKEADRTSPYDGDYYGFKEIERGAWILRGINYSNS